MSDPEDAFRQELKARLGSYLKRAEQAVMGEKARVLAPFDLTVPQYSALLFLLHVPDASAAQLSRACLVTPQTMATIVGNLELKGLVTRRSSSVHLRVRHTALTDAGEDLVREADVEVRKVEQSIREQFTPEEFDALTKALDRVADAART